MPITFQLVLNLDPDTWFNYGSRSEQGDMVIPDPDPVPQYCFKLLVILFNVLYCFIKKVSS
jgi:hypothetical protein